MSRTMQIIYTSLALLLLATCNPPGSESAESTPSATFISETAIATANATMTAMARNEVKANCANGECLSSCLDDFYGKAYIQQPIPDSPPPQREDDKLVFAVYRVNEDSITLDSQIPIPGFEVYQNEFEAHERIWHILSSLIPPEERDLLYYFIVYTDNYGADEESAYVDWAGFGPQDWSLAVDLLDTWSAYDLLPILIHESSHLMTLNVDQIDTAVEEEDCSGYYIDGDGCSSPDSYLNLFYLRFWESIYPEFKTFTLNPEIFYDLHRDQFITEYAAINPKEDFAESWIYFILHPKPDGSTIPEHKILFFYEFPELTDLRLEIIARICTYTPPKP